MGVIFKTETDALFCLTILILSWNFSHENEILREGKGALIPCVSSLIVKESSGFRILAHLQMHWIISHCRAIKLKEVGGMFSGATRDIGACLTRVCMRQRSIENRLRSFVDSLTDELAMTLQNKSTHWKQRTMEMDRHANKFRRKVNCKVHYRCRMLVVNLFLFQLNIGVKLQTVWGILN